MSRENDLPEVDPYRTAKLDLEIRAMEHGRTSDEQFLAEAAEADQNAFIGGRDDLSRSERVVKLVLEKTFDGVDLIIGAVGKARRRNV